jgi:hypothetical protein
MIIGGSLSIEPCYQRHNRQSTSSASHRREHRTKRRGSPSARVRVCAREEQPAEEPRRRSIPSAVGRAAEGSAGLQVEHQLVLRRRLHRKVGWLLASKDAVNVFRSSPNYHQTAHHQGELGEPFWIACPAYNPAKAKLRYVRAAAYISVDLLLATAKGIAFSPRV